MKWGGLCLWGNKCQMNKSYNSAGLFYKRIYKRGSFNTLNLWAVLQSYRDLREPDKWLKMHLRISQNPWNPAAAACWLRTCTPSLPSLCIAVHCCQAVLTRPAWLRVGSEPRQTDCWKANLLPSGTSQAPRYSCSRLPSLFCLTWSGQVFGGLWRWNWDTPKAKAAHYLPDISIWKMHNCRIISKPAYRWSLTVTPNVFVFLFWGYLNKTTFMPVLTLIAFWSAT